MDLHDSLILVHGKKSSGKDEFAKVVVEVLNDCHVDIYHFADPLKSDLARRFPMLSVRNLYGTPEEKEAIIPEIGMSARQLMQRYGTDWMSSVWTPVWANAAVEHVRMVGRFFDGARKHLTVIPDLRRVIEVEHLAQFNPTMVKVVRPGLESTDAHSSEHELDDMKFEHVIVNDGSLSEFKDKVRAWLTEWLHGCQLGEEVRR